MSVAAEIIVKGIVQGVGYRYFCLKKANELNLSGWVRNNHNGSVELLVQGEQNYLDEFVSLLRRGPMSADVTNVEVCNCEVTGVHSSFEVRD